MKKGKSTSRKIILFKLGEDQFSISRGAKSRKDILQAFPAAVQLGIIYVKSAVNIISKSLLVPNIKRINGIKIYHVRKHHKEWETVEAFKRCHDDNIDKRLIKERALYRLNDGYYAFAHGDVSKNRILNKYPSAVEIMRVEKEQPIAVLMKKFGFRICKNHEKGGIVIYKPTMLPFTHPTMLTPRI